MLDVLWCMGNENCFMECDAAKNVWGSEYHVREPAVKALQMTFSGFASCLAQWTAKNVFLRVSNVSYQDALCLNATIRICYSNCGSSMHRHNVLSLSCCLWRQGSCFIKSLRGLLRQVPLKRWAVDDKGAGSLQPSAACTEQLTKEIDEHIDWAWLKVRRPT